MVKGESGSTTRILKGQSPHLNLSQTHFQQNEKENILFDDNEILIGPCPHKHLQPSTEKKATVKKETLKVDHPY